MVELLLLSPVKHPRHWNPQRQHPSQALKPFSSFLLPSLPACGLGKKDLLNLKYTTQWNLVSTQH